MNIFKTPTVFVMWTRMGICMEECIYYTASYTLSCTDFPIHAVSPTMQRFHAVPIKYKERTLYACSSCLPHPCRRK